MIPKVKSALKKRKVKLFLIFLLCSGTAWFISQLSETYTSSATFDLNFTNYPEDFLLSNASKDEVDVKLRAVGFQFFGFNIKNKKVNIDLSQLQRADDRFFVPAESYRAQIEKQLPNSMTLLEMDSSPIYFDFLQLETKELNVKPKIRLNLAQDYLLDGAVQVDPSKITLKGPPSEIDTIHEVGTEVLDLTDLTSDFSKKIAIKKPAQLVNTTFSASTVLVKGKVARFSEKMVQVPVEVINLPDGAKIRTFPDQVAILVKAKIGILKDVKSSDFRVIGDYAKIDGANTNILTLEMGKKPKDIYSASMSETQVEFILNRYQ